MFMQGDKCIYHGNLKDNDDKPLNGRKVIVNCMFPLEKKAVVSVVGEDEVWAEDGSRVSDLTTGDGFIVLESNLVLARSR